MVESESVLVLASLFFPIMPRRTVFPVRTKSEPRTLQAEHRQRRAALHML